MNCGFWNQCKRSQLHDWFTKSKRYIQLSSFLPARYRLLHFCEQIILRNDAWRSGFDQLPTSASQLWTHLILAESEKTIVSSKVFHTIHSDSNSARFLGRAMPWRLLALSMRGDVFTWPQSGHGFSREKHSKRFILMQSSSQSKG